MKSSGMMTK